jgi:hypothetical protein
MGVQSEMQSWQCDNASLIGKLGGSWVQQQGPSMATLFANPLAWAATAAAADAGKAAGRVVFGCSDSTAGASTVVVAIAPRQASRARLTLDDAACLQANRSSQVDAAAPLRQQAVLSCADADATVKAAGAAATQHARNLSNAGDSNSRADLQLPGATDDDEGGSSGMQSLISRDSTFSCASPASLGGISMHQHSMHKPSMPRQLSSRAPSEARRPSSAGVRHSVAPAASGAAVAAAVRLGVGNAGSLAGSSSSTGSSSRSLAADLASAGFAEQEAPADGESGGMTGVHSSAVVAGELKVRPGSFKQVSSFRAEPAAADGCSSASGLAEPGDADTTVVMLISDTDFGAMGRGSRSSSTGGAAAAASVVSRRGSAAGAVDQEGVGSQQLGSLRAEPALPAAQPVLQHAASRLAAAGGACSAEDVDDRGEVQACDAKLKDE